MRSRTACSKPYSIQGFLLVCFGFVFAFFLLDSLVGFNVISLLLYTEALILLQIFLVLHTT